MRLEKLLRIVIFFRRKEPIGSLGKKGCEYSVIQGSDRVGVTHLPVSLGHFSMADMGTSHCFLNVGFLGTVLNSSNLKAKI